MYRIATRFGLCMLQRMGFTTPLQQVKAETPSGFDAWPFFVFAHARGPLHV